ncbi:alpha/beta hydrolase [Sphingomonas sp. LB-2]|uniref:alpha/beta hydrolase n=1 Tax=Sphingomonas caeni TaxID=2984949 RepID=UPI00222F6A58|nr:alpha/beta hydrolase [Sphingomonas caeni]MCW3847153.1 alpha/beta hydrolase [Sphingomonas caeni]
MSGLDLLTLFNALMPKDPGSRRIARDIPYGGHPRQTLDLYAPRTRGPHPLIIFFYGGAWESGHRQGYAFAARALAAKGFVVAVPDYRLVPEVRYPDFVRDGAAAVRRAMAHASEYGGDDGRIVLIGHSAGAYIAAMLALDPEWLGDGREAVRGFAGLAGPYDFLPLDDPASIAAFGDWPDLPATQPVIHAGPDSPPALLLHGEPDTRVKPRHSKALAAALGDKATLKLYPKLSHTAIVTALALPLRGQAPVLADIAAFARGVTR